MELWRVFQPNLMDPSKLEIRWGLQLSDLVVPPVPNVFRGEKISAQRLRMPISTKESATIHPPCQ